MTRKRKRLAAMLRRARLSFLRRKFAPVAACSGGESEEGVDGRWGAGESEAGAVHPEGVKSASRWSSSGCLIGEVAKCSGGRSFWVWSRLAVVAALVDSVCRCR